MSTESKKSKYATIVRMPEEIENEEAAALESERMKDSEPVIVKSAVATKESMAELAALTEKMSLDKRDKIRERKAKGSKSSASRDVNMNGDVPKINIKSKPI